MYATLRYKTNWDARNILVDLVAVLTGETSPSNLSSSIRVEETEIISTVAAGWLLHDDIDATQVVLKAPIIDDANVFKYVRLALDSNTPTSRIKMYYYSNWDNVAHSGTEYGQSVYISNEVNLTNFFEILISASSRHIAIQNVYNDNKTPSVEVALITEHTRDSKWDTVVAGYTPVVAGFMDSHTVNSSSPVYANRMRWPQTLNARTLAVLNDKTAYWRLPLGSNYNSLGDAYAGSTSGTPTLNTVGWSMHMADSTGVVAPTLMHIGVVNPSIAHKGGDISFFCNIHPWTDNLGYANDVLLFNGERYRLWTLGMHRLAVKEI